MANRVAMCLCIVALLGLAGQAGAADAQFRIQLRSGNEVLADKATIQDDRLVYERYGTQGTIRLADVQQIVDKELEGKMGLCRAQARESAARIQGASAAANQLHQGTWTREGHAAIDDAKLRVQAEAWAEAQRACNEASAKMGRNQAAIEAARKKAGK